jgi:hypothetical protein
VWILYSQVFKSQILLCPAQLLLRSIECGYTQVTSNSVFLLPVDLMKPDSTVIIRNAKIDMFKGSMRLAVDKWGRIEVTEPGSFSVKEDSNLSLVEYELVNVEE